MRIITLIVAVQLIIACDDKSPKPNVQSKPTTEKKPAAAKTVELAKNISLEVQADGKRRVLVQAEVCQREGPLEMFLCRKMTKEHESIIRADIDARELHKALLAAGAVVGSPVRFEPKYQPPKGTTIKVFVRYTKDGQEKTVNAREWIARWDIELNNDWPPGDKPFLVWPYVSFVKKELHTDWVFAGSFFYPGPDDDPAKPTQYAGNSGAVVCVSNFPDATLDIPLASTDQDEDLMFEAYTERIPELGTKVTVIFEPQVERKK